MNDFFKNDICFNIKAFARRVLAVRTNFLAKDFELNMDGYEFPIDDAEKLESKLSSVWAEVIGFTTYCSALKEGWIPSEGKSNVIISDFRKLEAHVTEVELMFEILVNKVTKA